MERLKLRSYVIPLLLFILILGLITTTLFMQTSDILTTPNNYVTDTILEEEVPVMEVTKKMINPYQLETISIGKNYYEYTGTEEEQTKSIIKYDDTYIQNTGVDFVDKNVFDVLSVLDGEVISITEDEMNGNKVVVQHDNGYTSIYESLSEVVVKEKDKLQQGQVIGKSGTNKIDKELGNHLHFELLLNNIVNPSLYLNKSINNVEKGE